MTSWTALEVFSDLASEMASDVASQASEMGLPHLGGHETVLQMNVPHSSNRDKLANCRISKIV